MILKQRLLILFAGSLALFNVGCDSPSSVSSGNVRQAIAEFENFRTYQPAKAVFLPLTELKHSDSALLPDSITAYLALLDSAGCAVKAPVMVRFELYEFVPRSAQPKGKRVHIWQDMNLLDFYRNNEHWRDYLRAYEFKLTYPCPGLKKYILEATCLCPSGRRLNATTTLQK